MTKKIFALLFAILLCLSSFLTACSTPDDSGENGNSSEETKEEIKKEVLKVEDGKSYTFDNATSVFSSGMLDQVAFRIPSLISTKSGTVIAAIGAGHNVDCGNISLAIRVSKDGGKSWGDPKVLMDPPYGAVASTAKNLHSLVIDPLMVYDSDIDRTYLFISFYPESMAYKQSEDYPVEASVGYKSVDGEMRLVLRDYTGKNVKDKTYTKEYTVGSDGVVYDENNKKTAYTLPSFFDGTLYKNGKSAGSIFLYTGKNKGELTLVPTQYLLEFHSDDDGKTWSDAVCLNGQVKPESMVFGVGPGRGIQLSSGRLVVPMWSEEGCCVIYSDDHGSTWKRGDHIKNTEDMELNETQVVEVTDKNGNKMLKLFCRDSVTKGHPRIFTSTDGGQSWKNGYIDNGLTSPDCQASIINLPFELEGYEGKELVLYSAPGSTKERKNGTLTLGMYDPESDKFEWIESYTFTSTTHMYSCLTVLPDNTVALLYEESIKHIKFGTFHIGFVFNK